MSKNIIGSMTVYYSNALSVAKRTKADEAKRAERFAELDAYEYALDCVKRYPKNTANRLIRAARLSLAGKKIIPLRADADGSSRVICHDQAAIIAKARAFQQAERILA